MSITIEQMLENRSTVHLEWVDPWKALDSDLDTFDACNSPRDEVI